MTTFAEQCVGYVRRVLDWVPGGPQYAGQYLAQAPKLGLATSTTPAVGDAAVWLPGHGGADAVAGHIAVVTGVDNTHSTVTVSESNWPEGVGPHARTVAQSDISGYLAPGGTKASATVTPPPAQLAVNLNPLDLPGALAGAVGSGIAGAFGALFSGVAQFFAAAISNVGTFAKRNLVALGVAAVVILVLFR
jgi:surface antigen